MSPPGYTEDVLEYIRISVPKTMLADLKDSVKSGRSLNVQDRYGATAVSQSHCCIDVRVRLASKVESIVQYNFNALVSLG